MGGAASGCGGCGCFSGVRARALPQHAQPSKTDGPPRAPKLLSAAEREVAGWGVLAEVLEIELRCLATAGLAPRASGDAAGECGEVVPSPASQEAVAGPAAEVLLNEPNARYCICAVPDSPLVVCYFRVRLDDVHIGDAWHALVDSEERRVREPDTEYEVLQEAKADDPTSEEALRYVMRAPWPFADRDVLQRRWQLPLVDFDGESEGGKLGIAIVMQSFDDAALVPLHPSRVRARISKSACLLRAQGEDGVEISFCQQLDLGGRCPPWAQSLVTRFAVQSAIRWAETLRGHCGMMRDHRHRHGREVGDMWKEGGLLSGGPGRVPPPTTAAPRPPAEPTGEELLEKILAVEQLCLGQGDGPPGEFLQAQCLMDGPVRYFVCASLSSPVVTGYIQATLPSVRIGDAWSALVTTEERLIRNPDSEYTIFQEAQPDDPQRKEVLRYVMKAPSPFWDRDVLQRRWQLPLPGAEGGIPGLAIVMRSIEDDSIFGPRDDKVRSFVHKCGYLLRPTDEGGLNIVCCQQLDMGGLCPAWAQSFLTRMLVQKGNQWVEELKVHCAKMQARRSAEGREVGDAWQPQAWRNSP